MKPWYVQIQQNWAISLQVYATHFEYWLPSKFSHLTTRENKSRPGKEIFRTWMRGNKTFFPIKRENNGKIVFIWPTLNLKLMIMWEYKNIFAKGYVPNWCVEVFLIKNVKNTVPCTYLIEDLNGKEIVANFL